MKKVLKLTFATLALAGLASCSGDDMLGNSNNPLQKNKKGILVEVDDMIDPLTTRAAFTPNSKNGGDIHWMEDDQIWVMDKTLTMYDKYVYHAEDLAFVPASETDNVISNPEYALFQPGLQDFRWNYNTKGSEVEYEIPATWGWEENTDATGDGTMAYLSNLPMWGDVTPDETYGVRVEMHYLTSILRVDLQNVPNNATGFIVEGYSDTFGEVPVQMSGKFKATLAVQPTGTNPDAKLEVIEESADNSKNSITVDLTKATFEESYLFIPIIARKYGMLKFYYTTDARKAQRTLIKAPINVNYEKAGTSISLQVEAFKTAGVDIPAINRALETQKESSSIVIETSKITNVTAEENTIVIPAGTKAESITLSLTGINATDATVLSVISEDHSYEGKLVIEVPTAENSAVNGINNVYVSLPKADVAFAGNWGTVNLGNTTKTVGNFDVKTLSIAKDATVNNIYPDAESCSASNDDADILVAEGAAVSNALTLQKGAKIDNITINGYVKTVNAAVAADAEGTPAEVNVDFGATANVGTLHTYQKKINVVKGAQVGTLYAKNGGTVTVAGKVTNLYGDNTSLKTTDGPEVTSLSVSGADATSNGIVSKAYVRGANVTVAKTAYVTGISNLYMGENKKLTLTGGIITTITEGKNLTISNNEKYPTSITNVSKGVTFNEDGYTSVWCGTAHTSNINPTKVTNDEDAVINEIMTASQFVKWAGSTASGVKLAADIDLNEKPFTPNAEVSVCFDGNNKTISKVSITTDVTKTAGLFKYLKGEYAEVKDLTINGIAINQTTENTNVAKDTDYPVGALAAYATGGKVTNVNVKFAELINEKSWIVGGLIGYIEGDVTIDGGSEKATVKANIKGKNMLGGLVGQIKKGNVIIKNYKSDADFTVTEVFDEDNRSNAKNYGTVAPYVGTAKAGSLELKDADATEFTFAQRTGLGFKNNRVGDDNGSLYDFVGHTEIGYVSANSFSLNTSINDLTVLKAKTKDELTNSTNKNKLNIYLLESEYKDQ